jgi:hypothetical protein
MQGIEMEKDYKNIPLIASSEELGRREKMVQFFRNSPIPDNEILANLGLFQNGPSLARVLFMNELYQKIIDTHGIIIEFGCRWGQNLALFGNFRGIYEPFNFTRKVVGFDTFQGFPHVSPQDGPLSELDGFTVTPNYEDYLGNILDMHERDNPVGHIKKFELIKGDAPVELCRYLNDNPETIIALAYFDLDLYEPTKSCLEIIQDYLTKGSVIGFDELNFHLFPGETLAFKEVMGLSKYRIKRSIYSRVNSYIVIE